MKRYYPIYQLLFVAFLMGVSFVSCVKEDFVECPTGEFRLYFNYTAETLKENGTIKQGINVQNVSRINLYVFDEENKFVQEIIDENPTINEDYYIEIPNLPNGNYRFIAWGGLDNEDTYKLSKELVKGETTFSELQLHLNKIENNTVTTSLPHLFYAAHGQRRLVSLESLSERRDTLNLFQNTYKVNVAVTNMQSNNDTYQLRISDNNHQYNFNNEIVSTENLDYLSTCRKVGTNKVESSLTVLKLLEERNVPTLQIINKTEDEPLFDTDYRLVELMLALKRAATTDIDLSIMHEFNIEFEIKDPEPGKDMEVTIRVNGWEVNADDEQLYQ